jgi:membrane protease subunit HflK
MAGGRTGTELNKSKLENLMAWNEPGGNGKDPWGNRKNEQGPPDLDELIKKMQDRLGGLFGGGGSSKGSGGDNTSGEAPNFRLYGIVAGIVLVLWLIFGGLYIVQPAEQGLETRFGKYTQTTEQGLNWHIPYPIEDVVKINVQEVRATPHKAIMLTQDENIVDIELVVQYRVKDPVAYQFNVREADETLHQATESALREVVGTSKMDDVLTSGRDLAASRAKLLIQEILDRYSAGLEVRSVNMQNAQPPEAVQAAFADVIKAREDEERSKNTAQAYANEIVQKAGGAADRLRQEAEAYKSQAVALAEGETRRFLSVLAQYAKAPEITRQRLYLESVEQVLSNSSKIMVDVDKGNQIMYLPLDRLISGGAEHAPASDVRPQSGVATVEDSPASPRPGRDNSRKVDR